MAAASNLTTSGIETNSIGNNQDENARHPTVEEGKHALDSSADIYELIKAAVQQGQHYIKDDDVKIEFSKYSLMKHFNSIDISEGGKVCHPFKVFAAALVDLRQNKDFKSFLTSLLMCRGYSNMTGCNNCYTQGCKHGCSKLPKQWIEWLNSKHREWLKY